MQVVEPALHDSDVAGGEVLREAMDVAHHLEPVVGGKRGGVDPRAADRDHAEVRDPPPGLWQRVDHAVEEIRADS